MAIYIHSNSFDAKFLWYIILSGQIMIPHIAMTLMASHKRFLMAVNIGLFFAIN